VVCGALAFVALLGSAVYLVSYRLTWLCSVTPSVVTSSVGSLRFRGEMLSAENKDSFLPIRQKGSYLTCLDVSRKHGSKARSSGAFLSAPFYLDLRRAEGDLEAWSLEEFVHWLLL
ncbi:hypothetical protein Taro_004600, partial [Colocasia esculenta]|nr:hypothetical protein [Colocasia esculenta]